MNLKKIKSFYLLSSLLLMSAFLMGCGKKDSESLPAPVAIGNASKDSSSATSTNGTLLAWNSVNPIVINFPNTKKALIESAAYSVVNEWNSAIGRPFITYRFTDFNENVGSSGLLATQGTLRVYFKTRGQWSDISSNPNALATTFYSFSGTQIVDADIVFNGNFDLDYADPVQYSHFDFESILLHEMGHFLGLPHVGSSVDSLSVMSPGLISGQSKRSLSNGDITNIKARY